MRNAWGALSRRVPAGAMFLVIGAVFAALIAGAVTGDPPMAALLLAGLAPVAGGAVALRSSGAASTWGEAFLAPPGELRRRRRSAAQRLAHLERVSGDLRAHADRSASAASRLFGELVRAEEATRATLAGDLHDTVAQSLSAALSQLQEPGLKPEALEAVRDAEEQLRTVLARLRPPELERGDLALAVSDLCLDLEHRYGLEVEVSWPEDPLRLPVTMAVIVYRFLQESLLNALEHADGEGVRMALRATDEVDGSRWLRVLVSDEGPGFDPSAVVSTGGRHVGLRLAGERARLGGGKLTVDSAPGAGTRVELSLPLSAPLGTAHLDALLETAKETAKETEDQRADPRTAWRASRSAAPVVTPALVPEQPLGPPLLPLA